MSSGSKDTNILLLGQSGNGKSTFINAFVNHLVHSSLTEASNGELLSALPASFSLYNPKTSQHETFNFGQTDNNEKHTKTGNSVTQGCRSHVFRIGNHILRLIDTPGIGVTEGVRRDQTNTTHILDFISQYKYLKGICILFKPNEERLNPQFRYCVLELLTRLHKSAANNIMFVFTTGRATFYAPGSTAPLLRVMLTEIENVKGFRVPFNGDNTFCIDNEGFRCAVAMKSGRIFPSEEVEPCGKSWEKSAKEYIRLFETVMRCSPHEVLDTRSINAAEQYIRLLARPMSEAARLIAENRRLAEEAKYHTTYRGPRDFDRGRLVQKQVMAVELPFPRTVCTAEGCTRLYQHGTEMRVEYTQRCHDECYLRKVQQEVIGDPGLLRCRAFEGKSEYCHECGCSYRHHQHITYEIQTRNEVLHNSNSVSIQKHIEQLIREQHAMANASAQFSFYLEKHAIAPFNDAFIDYLDLFIRAEEMKPANRGGSNKVLEDLKQLAEEHNKKKQRFRQRPDTFRNDMTASTVFDLIDKLYDLPINGKFILKQMKILKGALPGFTKLGENMVALPNVRRDSSVMHQLKVIFGERVQLVNEDENLRSSMF